MRAPAMGDPSGAVMRPEMAAIGPDRVSASSTEYMAAPGSAAKQRDAVVFAIDWSARSGRRGRWCSGKRGGRAGDERGARDMEAGVANHGERGGRHAGSLAAGAGQH